MNEIIITKNPNGRTTIDIPAGATIETNQAYWTWKGCQTSITIFSPSLFDIREEKLEVKA